MAKLTKAQRAELQAELLDAAFTAMCERVKEICEDKTLILQAPAALSMAARFFKDNNITALPVAGGALDKATQAAIAQGILTQPDDDGFEDDPLLIQH